MATVLHETTFEVNSHAMTTVIGPNGAGKSTALKAVFGMVKVESGRIVYDGNDIVGLPQLELLNRGIAFVPQGRNIFPRMSVRDNLELGGVSLKDLELTRHRIDTIAFEQFPVLANKSNQQAGTLSGGEQKMLEVGRALLLEPRLLLIDEPSIGLSPLLVSQVFGLLRGLVEAGITVLMIEQNAKKALEVSDFGIVLQQGRAVLAGRADEILAHPQIGSLFLGGLVKIEEPA
jgi:branched-chain amino acid transport system ATP-binding protein